MADFGNLPIYTPATTAVTFTPITDHHIRLPGFFYGSVGIVEPAQPGVIYTPATNYAIRMLLYIVKQLWPDKGQRFPQ